MKNRIFITGGDPQGVGYHCLLKVFKKWSDNPNSLLSLAHLQMIYIGGFIKPQDRQTLQDYAKNHFSEVKTWSTKNSIENFSRFLCEKNCVQSQFIIYEVVDHTSEALAISNDLQLRCAYSAYCALEIACTLIKTVGCSGLCTLPVNKAHINQALTKLSKGKQSFVDHTTYLQEFFTQSTTMLMHGKQFSVLLLTSHYPLLQVVPILRQRLTTEQAAITKYTRMFCEVLNKYPECGQGDWVLCGVNPHAGELGLLGSEEQELLMPWLAKVNIMLAQKKSKKFIYGPLSADAIFAQGQLKRYRLIIANYHDQGLIPFKALEGMQGVNCTLGLSFLRTSPAHGTAFGVNAAQVDERGTENALRVILDFIKVNGEFTA